MRSRVLVDAVVDGVEDAFLGGPQKGCPILLDGVVEPRAASELLIEHLVGRPCIVLGAVQWCDDAEAVFGDDRAQVRKVVGNNGNPRCEKLEQFVRRAVQVVRIDRLVRNDAGLGGTHPVHELRLRYGRWEVNAVAHPQVLCELLQCRQVCSVSQKHEMDVRCDVRHGFDKVINVPIDTDPALEEDGLRRFRQAELLVHGLRSWRQARCRRLGCVEQHMRARNVVARGLAIGNERVDGDHRVHVFREVVFHHTQTLLLVRGECVDLRVEFVRVVDDGNAQLFCCETTRTQLRQIVNVDDVRFQESGALIDSQLPYVHVALVHDFLSDGREFRRGEIRVLGTWLPAQTLLHPAPVPRYGFWPRR